MENRLNIINFVRAVEPRMPMDLVGTMKKEIQLIDQYQLPATWLIQYDALVDPTFTEPLKSLDAKHEIGLWFEVVEPLVRDAGIPWRGRYPWDWHAHVGFSVGYTPAEREKLADVFMARFRQEFGFYPRSVGSWFIDAHLLGYLYDRYGITASCNCKDQWGTDGYTLWGGYYNHAYYPSRKNSMSPAQSEEGQIPVPVFRMLGSDPIYQYTAADNGNGQEVITLEPVYTGTSGGGGIPAWVRWFFRTNFELPQFTYGYTQVGQENSFGWEKIRDGLCDQIAETARLQSEGKVRVETLGDSGDWYRSSHPVTPAAAIYAQEDWRDLGHQSIWYYNRFYRVNLFMEQDTFRIRDVHRFDENYPERYLTEVCPGETCEYDTLPILDGGRWSSAEVSPGIFPMILNEEEEWETPSVLSMTPVKTDDDGLEVTLKLAGGQEMIVLMSERSITFHLDKGQWGLRLLWAQADTKIDLSDSVIHYVHNGYGYDLPTEGASLSPIFASTSAHILDMKANCSEIKLIL